MRHIYKIVFFILHNYAKTFYWLSLVCLQPPACFKRKSHPRWSCRVNTWLGLRPNFSALSDLTDGSFPKVNVLAGNIGKVIFLHVGTVICFLLLLVCPSWCRLKIFSAPMASNHCRIFKQPLSAHCEASIFEAVPSNGWTPHPLLSQSGFFFPLRECLVINQLRIYRDHRPITERCSQDFLCSSHLHSCHRECVFVPVCVFMCNFG